MNLNKKSWIAIVLLIVVTSVSYKLYLYYKPENATELPQNQNPSDEGSVGWSSYKNEKYGYSVEYPSDWHFQSINSSADFIQQGPNKYNVFTGKWYITPKDPKSYDVTNLPDNLFEVGFTIYKVEPAINFETFFSNFKFDLSEFKQESIEINGKLAYKISFVNTDTNTGKIGEYNQFFIKDGDKVFMFSYHGYPISDVNRDIAERVVQSFKIK